MLTFTQWTHWLRYNSEQSGNDWNQLVLLLMKMNTISLIVYCLLKGILSVDKADLINHKHRVFLFYFFNLYNYSTFHMALRNINKPSDPTTVYGK